MLIVRIVTKWIIRKRRTTGKRNTKQQTMNAKYF